MRAVSSLCLLLGLSSLLVCSCVLVVFGGAAVAALLSWWDGAVASVVAGAWACAADHQAAAFRWAW